MRFQGRVYKDGKHWLAEVPVFNAITQGRTRKAAIDMIVDWFVTMVDQQGFSVRVHSAGRAEFEISADHAGKMISFMLRRQRQKSGLTLAQAADRLGAKSRNAYARYEQGRSVPTVEKLDQLLRAVAPDRDIVVRESNAA
jgi:DNA-binding XRE family transcriptional regulator